jgi:hypothetical protein
MVPLFLASAGLCCTVACGSDRARFGWHLSHGFNYMAQIFGCDEHNAVWVLPRSHRAPRADIPTLLSVHGGDVLPDAVPLVRAPSQYPLL